MYRLLQARRVLSTALTLPAAIRCIAIRPDACPNLEHHALGSVGRSGPHPSSLELGEVIGWLLLHAGPCRHRPAGAMQLGGRTSLDRHAE